MKALMLACALIAIPLVLLGCTGSAPAAGGGSEGEARVVCAIRNTDGSPAAGADVRMRRTDYLAAIPAAAKTSAIIGADARTDTAGRFSINGIQPGMCCIEINNEQSAVLLSCTIGTSGTADLGSDTLRPFAVIAGVIDSGTGAMHVQVYGLERIVNADSTGRFVIADLPHGAFNLRITPAHAGSPAVEVSNVKAISGDTAVIAANVRWTQARRLYLNTTASGVGVYETVTGFPLLVRLDASHVDFSQTGDSGRGLRFLNSRGVNLPCHIERWDAASTRAEVWVRIDTIQGNDSAQFFTMIRGASSPPTPSHPATVFDTADGWVGVWHFGEQETMARRDATVNGFNGAPGAFAGSGSVPGIIGACDSMNAAGYIDAGDIDIDRQITVSAWLFAAAYVDWGKIIIKPTDTAALPWDSYSLQLDSLGQAIFTVSSPDMHTAKMTRPIPLNRWMLLTGTYDGAAVRIFIDGVEQASAPATGPLLQSDKPVFFGGGNENFAGNSFARKMDETSISRVARSAAWIRLSYESQRENQRIVR